MTCRHQAKSGAREVLAPISVGRKCAQLSLHLRLYSFHCFWVAFSWPSRQPVRNPSGIEVGIRVLTTDDPLYLILGCRRLPTSRAAASTLDLRPKRGAQTTSRATASAANIGRQRDASLFPDPYGLGFSQDSRSVKTSGLWARPISEPTSSSNAYVTICNHHQSISRI
jgi:hypothetical protein